jgi:hypothetical protein
MELLSPVGSLNGPAFAIDSKIRHFSLKPMPIRARLWADWLSTGLSPGPRQSHKPRCPPPGFRSSDRRRNAHEDFCHRWLGLSQHAHDPKACE